MKIKKANGAFSLIEMLVVITVIALLMGLAAPAFISLSTARKSGIYELKSFLELARKTATTGRRDIYVVFADDSFPTESGAFRDYAMFGTVSGDDDRPHNQESAVLSQELVQISEWRSLGAGLIFAKAEDFEVNPGSAFRTIVESPWRRDFTTRIGSTEEVEVELPFLMFNSRGRVVVPPFPDADALHVGTAEGNYTRAGGRVITFKRADSSGKDIAQTECLQIEFYTGKPRIITE